MNTAPNADNFLITEEQRTRAENWVQEAYADGRLDAAEFDDRLGQILTARTRGELNRAFAGLAQRPTSQLAAMVPAAAVRMPAKRPGGNPDAVATVAHLSPLVASFVGPLITLLISQQGTFARRQSAEALNFQILMVIAMAVVSIINPLNWITVPLGILWLVFTIHGGIKVLQGEDYRNPVLQVTKFRPVKA